MKKNFRTGQANELIKEGKVYDLHNMYVLGSVKLIPAEKTLCLVFDPYIMRRNDGKALRLMFVNIDYLECSPGFGTHSVIGLDEMGCKAPDDYDYDWLMDEGQAEPGDHLILRVDGGGTSEFIVKPQSWLSKACRHTRSGQRSCLNGIGV